LSVMVNGNNARQASDRQQGLRHQQQRLLLLRHAAKCQHEDGRCPADTTLCRYEASVEAHCWSVKIRSVRCHIVMSSRYVLSHYHRLQRRSLSCV
jgi:E1A/CREB-binding protein